MQGTSGKHRASLSRRAFEVLIGVAALGATLLVNVSTTHLAAKPEPKAELKLLDPERLRTASTANPCTAGRVFLTFDDGPGAYTEPILEVLRAYHVKATFFVLGSKVGQYPQTVRETAGDGHLVENHTWDHPHLADLAPAEIEEQVAKTQEALVSAGVPAPTMLRAPFNNQNDEVGEVAARHGLRVTQWDIDTNDWRGRQPEDIARTVTTGAQPDSVILLHDGIQDSSNTLAALPAIIEGVRGRGYCTSALS